MAQPYNILSQNRNLFRERLEHMRNFLIVEHTRTRDQLPAQNQAAHIVEERNTLTNYINIK